MDSKNLKRSKHHKKMKASTDNGNAEVFVLSPDILKKLGIQLGNESSSHGSDPDVAVAGVEIEKEPVNNYSMSNMSHSTDDTSILETASLMKKSVFLSPTFVTTVANVFPGEMEIANIVKEPDAPIVASDIVAVNSDIFPVDVDITNTICDTATVTETNLIINPAINGVFTTVPDIEHHNGIQIIDTTFEDYKNITNSSCDNPVANNNPITTVGDNLVDGENVMNCGNSISKYTDVSSHSTLLQAQKNMSKINIISEEIIGPSKLKGLKILPNINALTPVTIDTNIGRNINDTAHRLTPISQELSECKPHGNEVLIMGDIPKVNSTENILNKVNTIDGDVTQKYPEEKMSAAAHDCDNNTSQVICNVVNPKVYSLKSVGNSKNKVNIEETCDSDFIPCYVENNTEKKESDIDELTSEVAVIKSFKNDVYSDLNETVNKLHQNEILYADDIMEIDGDSKTLNVINTTYDVKQVDRSVDIFYNKNDSLVKLNFNSDASNIKNSIIASLKKKISESNDNNSSDNKRCHDLNENIQNKLEHPKEFAGKTISHKCEVIYSNENDILLAAVDDNSKISKEKKGKLDILKQSNDSITSLDTMSNKMESLVTHDYQELKINKKENPKETDKCIENNLEINESILSNGTVVSDVLNVNSHNENSIQAKGAVLSSLNNTSDSNTFDAREVSLKVANFDNCKNYINNDAIRDANEHRNLDLEIDGNKNCIEHPKVLQRHTDNTKNEKYDHTKVSGSIHGVKNLNSQTIENCDSIKSNDEVQQDNKKLIFLNMNNDSISSNTNTNLEKVKEIAEYLKTLTYNNSGKKKMQNKKITKNNKHKSIEGNPNTIKSKLSIQGVEKPGGMTTNTSKGLNVLKTYQRPNRPKNKTFPLKNECYNAECTVTDIHSEETIMAVIAADTKTQEFCLCNDFGRLDYYDCNDLYEHIHFRQQHNTNCDLDLIFNIYNDVVGDQKELNTEYITEEDTEKVELNICWNALQRELLDEDAEQNRILKDANPNSLKFVKDTVDSCAKPNLILGLDLKNPGIKDMEKSDIMPSADADIHKSNLINLQDSQVSAPNKNIDNSDLIRSENLNMDSKTVKVPKTEITYIKSEISTNNIEHDMDYFGENVMASNISFETEIGKAGESTFLEAVNADETINEENSHSMNKNESTDSEEENLLHIKEKRIIQNRKENKLISREISNRNLKRRWESPRPRRNKCTYEPDNKKNIKCAVCGETFSSKKWESHVIGRHQFIAWRAGDDFDLDDADLQEKLTQSLKLNGYLKCTFCILNIYNLKKFIKHVRTCMQLKDGVEIQPSKSTQSNVICGVCQEEVQSSHWLEHIARQHNYLAWIDGVEPLNLDDEIAVRDHMRQIVKQQGEVYCYKCNFGFKYPRVYLSHMESCNTVESAMPSSSIEAKPFFTCGVCKALVLQLCWIEHIAKEHNYLAWQEGSLPLNLEDKDAVWNHLQEFIRHHGGLTCHKCGLNRKRVKVYLDHIKICEGRAMDSENVSFMNDTNDSTVSDYLNTTDEKVIIVEVPPVDTMVIEEKEHMTCGVCKQVVPTSQWIEHISKEHQYMAWEDGSPALDVKDEEAVRAHLFDIAKENNGLVCNKCGATRKYIKVYLEHIKECNISFLEKEIQDNSKSESVFGLDTITTESVICGACKAEVKKEDWIQHMTTKHEYISWIDGQTPIDIENEDEVLQHLTSIHRVVGGFTCRRCDIVRKYPKKYMQHVKTCKPESSVIHNAIQNNELIECAICHEKMDPNDWKSHAMKEHYNVAWVVGEPEFDINNPCAVEPLLKEYEQKHKKLTCKRCGLVRLSRFGFYCHIWSCGKSEADLEQYKITCDICNKQYLCIYKMTHTAAHRAEQKAERRRAAAPPPAAPPPAAGPEEPAELLSGRRRAAEKAKIVLKKYTKGVDQGCHRCPTCGYSTEIESELAEHVCGISDGNYSDSDKSVNMDQWSEDESVDTDVDSNISDEDMISPMQHKSHSSKHSEGSSAARVQRIPFSVPNTQSYLKRSGKEFIEMYWSAEDLFPQWYSCEYEVLNEQEEANYLPPIEESCKIRAVDKQYKWSTHKRFEASKRNQCIPIFVGAVIRCIAWAPSRVASAAADSERSYLAVACHLSHDEPRHEWDHTAHGPALIQIWDYGDMQGRPQLALCLALSGGAVWAVDWCPSGTRAPFTECDAAPCRLGLLAVACSDGIAYIFSVPYPSTIKQENKLFYKLKPVAKLKLTMSSERKVYSATSLKWSPQNPHNHIIVGYSDGTIAYYDLNTESPILKVTEDNVTIFYPYYDERFLNGSVEGVDMYPTGSGSGAGAACGACAAGGGAARAGGGRRGAARLAPPAAAAAGAAFLPHWPSAVLFGDDVFMSSVVNEMEWWGGGRRFGGARAAAGCVRCGRAALASQRLLRLYNAHPIEPQLNKLVVGVIEMVPLSNKRKRKKNDDLSIVLEPTTYEDAVKKYGLEYEIVTGKDKVAQQKVTTVARPPFPERYPLAEMTSLAFCTAERHHDKLAVALHAGFVLIVSL